MLKSTLEKARSTLAKKDIRVKNEMHLLELLEERYPQMSCQELGQWCGLSNKTVHALLKKEIGRTMQPRGGANNVKKVLYQGILRTYQEICDLTGLPYHMVNASITRGQDLEKTAKNYKPIKKKYRKHWAKK